MREKSTIKHGSLSEKSMETEKQERKAGRERCEEEPVRAVCTEERIRDMIREEEAAWGAEEDAAFLCDGCGEVVAYGETCLFFFPDDMLPGGGRSGRAHGRMTVPYRFCRECADIPDTLTGHLDLLGVRYFRGSAEDGERWLSINR